MPGHHKTKTQSWLYSVTCSGSRPTPTNNIKLTRWTSLKFQASAISLRKITTGCFKKKRKTCTKSFSKNLTFVINLMSRSSWNTVNNLKCSLITTKSSINTYILVSKLLKTLLKVKLLTQIHQLSVYYGKVLSSLSCLS